MTESITWDGRASFYPEIGYDIDKAHIKIYEDVMEREGFREENSEASEDSESDDSDVTDGDAKGVTYQIFTSPPLYDRHHHYHPFHNKDWRFSAFLRMDDRFQAQQLADSLVSRFSKKTVPTTGPRSIPLEVLKLIHQNRTNVPNVKKALTSTFILDLRITGLKEMAPNRRVRVPGITPLAEFHDRFLCSAFGWTRGYHTYAYAVPPSGYERQPPRSPHVDISFGAIAEMPFFSANHGFFGTLRNPDLIVDEDNVLLADLLQSPGHQLHHVLATSGWKTLITVEDVTTAGNLKPDILSGNETNVPENIIMEFDDIDTGGTQAYAYALELLRRADLDHNGNEWMRNEALRALRVEDQNMFDPRKPFDLKAARCALYNAFCDDPRPNPEHFNLEAMMMMMGMGLPGGAPPSGDTKNTKQDTCNQCHKTTDQMGSKTLKKCTRCQHIKYCSKECQKQDWKAHKKVCGKKI